MKQLILELEAPPAPTLANFAVGPNHELLHVLQQFNDATSSEHFLYLWGATATGKSHLLQALAGQANTRYVAAASAETHHLLYDPSIRLYLLDDCESLNPERQIDAFALFNQIRENNGFLISSAKMPPANLPVREDLRTRMGWGLIYQLHALTDADKIQALQQTAVTRGWNLSPLVLPWLIIHYQRDMRSLTAVLDALDHYSIQTHRHMTLPLLRQLLPELTRADAPPEF